MTSPRCHCIQGFNCSFSVLSILTPPRPVITKQLISNLSQAPTVCFLITDPESIISAVLDDKRRDLFISNNDVFSSCVCSGQKTSAEETLNMLSPVHQPLSGSAGGPGLYTSPSPCASSGGFSVTVLPAITSFFSSLSPGYVPEGALRQLVASTTANAGETVVINAGKHDTDAVLDKVKLACTIASCWVPTVRVVTEAVTTICSSFALAQSLGSVLERKDGEQQSCKKQSSAPRPDSTNAAAATLLTLVALDNLAPAAAVPAPGERGSPQQPINVSDSETLSRIGQPDYPTDAYYLQTQSFSHNRTEPGPAFQGHYQGGCHTISDLKTCLFGKLDRYGVVRDLHLTNATIDSDVRRLGAVACEMAPFASVRDMHIDHIKITNRAEEAQGETLATGVVVGRQHRAATISGMTIANCLVNTTAYNSPAGIIGGEINGLARDINITDCRIFTRAERSKGGIGAALLRGELDGLTVVRGEVRTNGECADAAIGAGDVSGGRLKRFAASHCQARTHGLLANAGIGAGFAIGDLDQLRIVDCLAETNANSSFAGIGAGQLGVTILRRQGRMKDMISVDNRVITRGSRAWAGIGAGQLTGEANNIVAINSSVRTEHSSSPAAIGAGFLHGQLQGLTAINCTVVASGRAALEAAETSSGGSANGTRSLNTQVNGRPDPKGTQVMEPFCTGADSRFLTANCRVTRTPLPPVSWNCSSEPLNPAHGSFWQPIKVNDTSTLNNIGLNDSFPSSAHYVQTADLNGTALHGNESLVFNGHYDARNHSIEGLQTCLVNHLQGTVKNLRLTDAHITANRKPAGVVACTMGGAGAIKNVHLSNCRVASLGISEPTGLVCGERIGQFNRVAGAVVHNSTLETSGMFAPAGMVAGRCDGKTVGIYIHGSRVVTRGYDSAAGLGCGVLKNRLDQMVSICSEVETRDNLAAAGIGAGVINDARIGSLTSVNSSVTTGGFQAPAGTGAGYVGQGSMLTKINAIHSRVTTTGPESSAGAGAGVLKTQAIAANLILVRCEVITRGHKADAGVCTGGSESHSIEAFCTSVDSSAHALGENSSAYLESLQGIKIDNWAVNTQLNNRLYDTGGIINRSTLCSSADARVLRPDCQSALAQSCPTTLQSFYLPPPLAAAPLATGLSTAAIAGIVAGGAMVLLGAGYCYYRHRSSGGEEQARRTDSA